jgi:DNA repair protein RadA/Sms
VPDPCDWETCEAETPRFANGIRELDRVLGSGIDPSAVLLLGGEPGVGSHPRSGSQPKRATPAAPCSTSAVGNPGGASRELPGDPQMLVIAETRVEAIGPWREASRAGDHRLDQTMRTDRVESRRLGGAGSRVRGAAGVGRRPTTALVLVGHVTKEGAIAGPRVLEHLVDVVLTFERSNPRRAYLRATKNPLRLHPGVGVFSMTGAGLEGVDNPAAVPRDGPPGFPHRALPRGHARAARGTGLVAPAVPAPRGVPASASTTAASRSPLCSTVAQASACCRGTSM